MYGEEEEKEDFAQSFAWELIPFEAL